MGKAGSICQRLTLPSPAPLLQRTLLPREGWRTSSLVDFSELGKAVVEPGTVKDWWEPTCRSSDLRVGKGELGTGLFLRDGHYLYTVVARRKRPEK